MGGFRRGHCRRVAAALGLLGIILYAGLVPGHLVSQTITALVHAELGVIPICHPGGVGAPGDNSKKEQSCPFCHGYASYMAAAPSSAASFIVRPRMAECFAAPQDDFRIRRASLTPQSRGPPQVSV